MSKSGSIWPWLIGGAAVVGGVALAASAGAKEPPRVPTFWERHHWDRLYEPMPPAAFEEVRRDVLKYYADKGLVLAPNLIVLDKNFKAHLRIDASALSVEEKQKLYQKLSKINWPDMSEYGLNGYGISYGSTPWEVIRGEVPAKK
jgi:hypothetical protein